MPPFHGRNEGGVAFRILVVDVQCPSRRQGAHDGDAALSVIPLNSTHERSRPVAVGGVDVGAGSH